MASTVSCVAVDTIESSLNESLAADRISSSTKPSPKSSGPREVFGGSRSRYGMSQQLGQELEADLTAGRSPAVLVEQLAALAEAGNKPVDDHVGGPAVKRDHVVGGAIAGQERHVGDATEVLDGAGPIVEAARTRRSPRTS